MKNYCIFFLKSGRFFVYIIQSIFSRFRFQLGFSLIFCQFALFSVNDEKESDSFLCDCL